MKNIHTLLGILTDNDFTKIDDFINFSELFLEFIAGNGMQADIVSRNEPKYHFYQYKEDGRYQVTRPINNDLFIEFNNFDKCKKLFKESLKNIRDIKDEKILRDNVNNFIYTCQQSIGATLDAFNNSNMAKKRNGNLFEILIRAIINEVGITVSNKNEIVNIDNDNSMSFQHDMVLSQDGMNFAIGSLKTSSKDRLDKIFIDKYMYNRLNNFEIPHFAIFLNDVQRKGTPPRYGINSTFLPGHFIAYSIALNPLDGVYYFDLRPNMIKDDFLSKHIKGFDCFLIEDMWKFKEIVKA